MGWEIMIDGDFDRDFENDDKFIRFATYKGFKDLRGYLESRENDCPNLLDFINYGIAGASYFKDMKKEIKAIYKDAPDEVKSILNNIKTAMSRAKVHIQMQ